MGTQNRNEKEGPRFSGGDGSSPESAVVIDNVSSHAAGVRAEKEYISRLFGEEGVNWRLSEQALLEQDGGPRLDRMTIETASGDTETLHFDVSNFFGMDF